MTLTLNLKLDSTGAKDGWMKCWLVIDDQLHYLDASSVFPPFGDVLNFIRAIAADTLPHEFFWEEEGHGARFKARQSSLGSDHVHVHIKHDGEVVVDADLERNQIVQSLLTAVRGFALDCPGAEHEWEFPYFFIENFERDLAQGFAPRTDELSIANFVFGHYGGYGGQTYPGFVLWLDERRAFYSSMDDIPRLWALWFELLQKVASGNLPFETSLDQAEEERDAEDLFVHLSFLDVSTLLLADWLPNPQHFQLKIIGENSVIPEPFVMVDATLERRAFVATFLEAFEKFLSMNYLAFLESDENKFDLRELPLDDLKNFVK